MASNLCCRLFPVRNVIEEKVFVTTLTKITIFITINTKCYMLFHNLLSLLTEIHSSSAGNFMFLSL